MCGGTRHIHTHHQAAHNTFQHSTRINGRRVGDCHGSTRDMHFLDRDSSDPHFYVRTGIKVPQEIERQIL